MPVEFALRPRIRLREDSPRPPRSRVRLPRFALPVTLYWLVAGGLTYAFVHQHDARPPLTSSAGEETALATEPTPRAQRAWWQRVPPMLPGTPANEAPARESASTAAASDAAPAVTRAAPDLPPPESMPAPATPPPELARAAGAIDSKDTTQTLVPRPPAPTRTSQLTPAEPRAFDDAPEAPAPSPSPSPPPHAEARNGLPSCEAALESAHQDVDFSQGNGTADLPTSVIAAVLENGAWLSSCGVPPNTSLDVCVAIRGGNVIGASVTSRPPSSDVTACVRRRASSLQFPYSSHVDIARTRF